MFYECRYFNHWHTSIRRHSGASRFSMPPNSYYTSDILFQLFYGIIILSYFYLSSKFTKPLLVFACVYYYYPFESNNEKHILLEDMASTLHNWRKLKAWSPKLTAQHCRYLHDKKALALISSESTLVVSIFGTIKDAEWTNGASVEAQRELTSSK